MNAIIVDNLTKPISAYDHLIRKAVHAHASLAFQIEMPTYMNMC